MPPAAQINHIKKKKKSKLNGLPAYFLISSLPEATHEEDDGDGGLQVCADGLDVDEELATLTGLDDGNPQNRYHHQHKHKNPAAQKQIK